MAPPADKPELSRAASGQRIAPRRTVAVAGCGPAGLAAALLLHRDGHRVTIFERFVTPQPVGSGLMLQPTGLAVLAALGLDDDLLTAGARIHRLFGQAAPSGRTVLDVRYAALRRPQSFGIGTHRAALFDSLHRAVRSAGVPIETSRTIATAPRRSDATRELAFADGSRAGPFDLVVDALGTGSPLAPRAGRALAYGALWATLDWPGASGFDLNTLEQRYVRASTMAGVLPIGTSPGSPAPRVAFFWSLRADRIAEWRGAGLDGWKREVLDVWPATAPLLEQIVSPDQLAFARYVHRTLADAAEPGLIHIGDAWHSTSPQLGQGANMALLDAYALAKALRGSDEVDPALQAAVALRRPHVRVYQGMSALFTPVYQSDSRALPWLRDRIVGPLARLWPATAILAAMVSGLIGRPLRPLGLSPDGSNTRLIGAIPSTEGHPLIVFDGHCVFCSTQAQFVLRHDRGGRFRLTTAQGELGREIYRRLGLARDDLQTVVVIKEGQAFTQSDAAVAVALELDPPWRWLAGLRIVPRPLRDAVYRFVASRRYRWFGRRDTCWLPTAEMAHRVL